MDFSAHRDSNHFDSTENSEEPGTERRKSHAVETVNRECGTEGVIAVGSGDLLGVWTLISKMSAGKLKCFLRGRQSVLRLYEL